MKKGKSIHTPHNSPRLDKVIEQFGESGVEMFLTIQMSKNIKNLGLNCDDVVDAIENICVAIRERKLGYRLMMDEWLSVFNDMNCCLDVRKDFSTANYIDCLQKVVDNKMKIGRAEREKQQAEKLKQMDLELRERYQNKEIGVDEYIALREQKEEEIRKEYFDY